MKIKILCTLGPASLQPATICTLAERGVDLFRINLSHTRAEELERTISLIRGHCSTPICIDTEGPQVRCGRVQPDLVFEEGARVTFTAHVVEGGSSELTLWPPAIFGELDEGHVISIDFDGALFRIVDVGQDRAGAVVIAPGRVRSNKAATLSPPTELPALSERDETAISIGVRHDVTHYALSFASSAENVSRLRGLAPPGARIMAKIESRTGVRNMDEITHAADIVLIDRGDLSREVPIENVPYYQKAIVRRCNRWNRPVYVATNLLESMVTNRLPTIAEANDIANTLLDGVHGLVLAAETAIGADPVGSVDTVVRAIRAFERANDWHVLDDDLARLRAVS